MGQKLRWLGRDERLYGLPSAEMEATTKSDGALANRQQVPLGGAALWAAAPGARQEPGSVNPTNDPLKNTDLGGDGIASTHCKGKGPVLDPPVPTERGDGLRGDAVGSSAPGGAALPKNDQCFT